jgi:putative phage-type endonuclease
METIKINDRQAWLRERLRDVTSTEVSALYGLNPYQTAFELYHRKKDQVVEEIEPSERMRWGSRLESAIAHGVAEDQGWHISKMDLYIRRPEHRLGSSFDFEILDDNDSGFGLLEIKNVSERSFREHWQDHGQDALIAPAHIELQLQHQMLVSGRPWGVIVALVGGSEARIARREADPAIWDSIIATVAAFWKRVKAGNAPAIQTDADVQFALRRLHALANAGEEVDASEEVERLLDEYEAVSKAIKQHEQQRDWIKAQILERVGPASRVRCSAGTLNLAMTKDVQPTVITPEMVGQTFGGRKGYRQFRFSRKEA